MSADPKVSVIMPVRNGERWLAQAVESVLAQTLSEFDLIWRQHRPVARQTASCWSFGSASTLPAKIVIDIRCWDGHRSFYAGQRARRQPHDPA